MKHPVTLAIVGAGKRGEAYSQYALEHPDLAKVVAVAEPRPFQREQMVQTHAIAAENVFNSWQDLARVPRLTDAALICTQDRMHLDPVLALAPKGYAILLEKPMSTNLAECERIVACVKQHGNLFAVCHVLLYTDFTKRLRTLLDFPARSGISSASSTSSRWRGGIRHTPSCVATGVTRPNPPSCCWPSPAMIWTGFAT